MGGAQTDARNKQTHAHNKQMHNERTLEEVLPCHRDFAELIVASHVLQESAVRPASAYKQAGQDRVERRHVDGESDQRHDGACISAGERGGGWVGE